MTTPDRGPSSERGIVLIGVLLLLMLIGAATAALTVGGQTELHIARNHEAAAQAQAAAEAGLNHGLEVTMAYLSQWQANGFANLGAAMTRMARGPDDQIGTTSTDADNGSLETWGIPREPTRVTLTGTTATYQARVFDDDDPARGFTMTTAERTLADEDGTATSDGNSRVVVRSIGYAGEGTIVRLEATIGILESTAITSNGNLIISGNPNIDEGGGGSVHANGNLVISGNPDITGNATAVGSYSVSGNPDIDGQAGGSYPNKSVAPVNAIDHRASADFILLANGRMTLQNGTVVCDASSDNDACVNMGYSWKFGGASGWNYEGNAIGANTDNRTWYFETDVRIPSNPGNNPNPLNITVIATGNIEISGNPTVEADTPGLLFVTDGDLVISGNLIQIGAEAKILVEEQMKISGNPTLLGMIEIENLGSASGLATQNEISGEANIINNGTLSAGGFTVNAWREIR